MTPWRFVAAGIIGYLLGGFPSALLVTRALGKADVRRVGSGHIGATNALRAGGWGAGIITLALDIAKGALAAWLGLWLAGPWGLAVAAPLIVAGHNWSPYIRFRGGMGLAALFGASLIIDPRLSLIGVPILVAAVKLLWHRQRGSILAMLVLPPVALLIGNPLPESAAVALGCGLVALRFLPEFNRQDLPGLLGGPEKNH